MKKQISLFLLATAYSLAGAAQEATIAYEKDVTDIYVTNPLFSANTIDGWQYDPQGSTPSCDWNAVEFFWSQGFDFYQTVTLPAGTYVMRGIAYYRGGGIDQAWAAHTEGTEAKHCWMYAGDERIQVMNMFEGNGPVEGNGWVCPPTGQKFPNWMNEARNYFDLGEYRDNVIEFTIAEDGTDINLGFRKYTGEYEDQDWMMINGIELAQKVEMSIGEIAAMAPEGNMSQEAADGLAAALDALKGNPCAETIDAYKAACEAAKLSIFKYQDAPADLTALVENAASTTNGWTCTEGASTWHINTWSHESATDGTGFDTPFCEYWTWVNGDANVFLNDATISYSVDGLPAGRYEVSMRIRIMQEADYTYSTKEIEGVTMFAGDADLPVAAGQPLVEGSANRGYCGTYTVVGNVDESGILTFGLRFAATNASWVIWKDITLRHLEDDPDAATSIQPANITRNATTSYNLAGQKVDANYRGIVIKDGVKTLNR